jgi:cysteine-rich repeat protein
VDRAEVLRYLVRRLTVLPNQTTVFKGTRVGGSRLAWVCASALSATAWHGGCLREASQLCSNGGVCPEGSQCTDTRAAQLCIRLTCGNGVVDPGEVCDDGNNQSDDGCPADCTAHCGDGVLDLGELCDDGNQVDGDGCSADCNALDGIALVSPPAVAFSTSEGDAPPASQTVSLRLAYRGTVALRAHPPSWLAVTSESATPYTAAFTLQVSDTRTAGRQSGTVAFAIQREDGGFGDIYDLPVTYDVRPRDRTMPATTEVHFVAPYVGVAGRGGTLYVSGARFRSSASLVTVALGDVVLAPVLPDSDTQITVSYPALPEGRYPVTVDGSPLASPPPELVIVPPSPTAYQAIDAHGPWTRIVYDAERRTIYGANALDQQIERVAYSDGAWAKLPAIAIPQLSDIALVPDGRSLALLDQVSLSEISLTDGLFTPVPLTYSSFCADFSQLATANSGTAIVISRPTRCSEDPPVSLLPLRGRGGTVYRGESTHNGTVAGSADGSRIYIGDQGSMMRIFESKSSTLTRSFPEGDVTSISVSDDASRVIVDGAVYSRALTHLGDLPPLRTQALASRDSTRAFVYASDDASSRLEIYDLSSPPPSGGQYPLLRTVMLPDAASDPSAGDRTVAIASSPDDSVVFISSTSKLLVVPVR